MRRALFLALLVLSCQRSKAPPDAGSTEARVTPSASASEAPGAPDAGERGAGLVRRFECRRCHDDEQTPPRIPGVRDDRHCFHCHQGIQNGEVEAREEATTARWKKSVARLCDVPSLIGARGRLRRAWIARFLLAPYDLRPRLDPTMPRLALWPEEAGAIAAYYAGEDDADKEDALAGADPAKGRALMEAKGCGSCHAFTGAPKLPGAGAARAVGEQGLTPAVTLAPDLRFARERLRPGALVTWLTSPKAMKADTPMPEPGLTKTEARDVAAYLLTA